MYISNKEYSQFIMNTLKYIFKCLCLVSAVCLIPWSASAQQTYTLDECIEQALQNNARIKNAANDLSMAVQSRKSTFTKYFPDISASGGGYMADEGLFQMQLQPGMALSMLKNGIVGGVSASMPLFTGGQIVNGNRLAKVNVEKYRLMQRQSENEVRLTTERYYWQVAMLKEKLNTLTTVERQLERLLADVDAAVQAGVANRNDLLQVQLKQNDMQSSRITVESGLALSRRLLAQYIGCTGDSLDVDFQATDSLPAQPGSLYQDPENALMLTPEYHLLQAKLKATKLEKKMAVGKQLPTVAIGGGYMYDNLMDRDQTFWLGFATVSVPLSGWWGGAHDIKRQKLAVSTAQNNLKDQSELLMIRMQSIWNDLNDAYRKVEIARRSIEQSTENLRLNTDYYHAGVCSMSELLDAQTLYQQSRDSYVEAYAQYEVKKREYLQATGR